MNYRKWSHSCMTWLILMKWHHESVKHQVVSLHQVVCLFQFSLRREASSWISVSILHFWILLVRSTQTMIYVHFLAARFKKFILLIVQYNFMMYKNLVRRIRCSRIWSSAPRLCGTGPDWLIRFRPKWSDGNILYQFGNRCRRAQQWSWPLNNFTWFSRAE